MATTGADAGWYPEPERGRLRYFDGEKWGPYAPEDTTSPASPVQPGRHSTAADSLQTRQRPEPTDVRAAGLLLGGKPSAFLRLAYALVAVGALVYGIWSFADNHAALPPPAWYTAVNYTVAILLGLAALAQAAAPVRFLWPGWLFIALAVLPIVWTSLIVTIAQITTYGIHRVFWLDFFFPLIMTIGMALALLAWHLLEIPAGAPADSLPDTDVTSSQSEPV